MSTEIVDLGRVGRVYRLTATREGPEPTNPPNPPQDDPTPDRPNPHTSPHHTRPRGNPMTTVETNHKLAYTINETARALGLSRSSIYKLINHGELPSSMIGHRRLIFAQDLNDFIQRHRNPNQTGGGAA